MLSMDLVLDPKAQRELQEKLSNMPPEIRKAMQRALLKFAGNLEAESVEKTPNVTGELRSRAFSELVEGDTIDDCSAVVGYEKFNTLYGDVNSDVKGKYYAIYVHEMNKNYHNGSWKFLENALKKQQDKFLPYLSDQLEKAIEDYAK